jgi:hypothetical protein
VRAVFMFLVAMFAAVPAHADFQRWSAETEEDPFSGGRRVTANFMSSLRSGVFIICDTAEQGLTVRAIPGFAHDPALESLSPEIEFAFDGKRLFGQTGRTGSVGDNLAAAETVLTVDNAWLFVEAFDGARKQIAVKDGISDRPHLLTAAGSSKAGAALVKCMQGQKPASQ